ncbi:MAG TPA: leucyl aminopeptidase, partial [Pyrinomonadaceae bacterium]|nr:leucyl aminopeptidase [Pyrinomonadaceae bacterium]
MDVRGSSQALTKVDAEALAVPVFKDEKPDNEFLKGLDKAVGGLISSVIKTEEFAAKEGETAYFHAPGGGLKARRLLLIGCGERKDYKARQVSQMAGSAARFLRSKNAKTIAIAPRFEEDAEKAAQHVIAGAIMGLFEPDKYRTKEKEEREIRRFEVVIDGADKGALQRGVDRGRIIGESVNFTRDLANEPGGFMTPTILAQKAKDVSKEFGLTFDALDKKQMEKLGMGSLLGVAAGSDEPPKLIVMKYTPSRKQKSNELLALVGKGITFDSGGISLKPGENMELMKYDMTGAATVIGTMRAIAQLKPSIPVLGVAPCSENLPSGKATKPGDVLRAMTGKTIEVINTDAEGRLVLADAIAYAKKLGATRVIDMATLTGAVSIALGDVNTAILGTDQDLIDAVISAGREVGEKFW